MYKIYLKNKMKMYKIYVYFIYKKINMYKKYMCTKYI